MIKSARRSPDIDNIDEQMSHNHGHGGCGGHADEHELPGDVLGYQDNLYNQIDRAHVVALNADGRGETVIKPWSRRNDEASARSIPHISGTCVTR